MDLRADGNIGLAVRPDAIPPRNAKKSDVKKILQSAASHFEELVVLWKEFMAKHSVITTDAEIDQAIGRADALVDDPRVISAEYKPGAGLDLLILKLSDGRRQLIPREDLQGLSGATRDQIANIKIVGNGTGLHWPELNLDHYVPSLLRHIYGTKHWMAEIGRHGGSAKSAAKRKASQRNGLRGGRPRQTNLATVSTHS